MSRGRVVLVGGGPGDPGLITVRGLQLLREADVVVHDRLAPLSLLGEARADAEIVDAGKRPGSSPSRQDDINALLVDRARAGKLVVRLKGGDPFVLGRGGEELLACAAAGVPCDVVPGLSSATAVPALAGVPLTHRGVTQEFAVVAGHQAPDDPRSPVDWAGHARSNATLVLLMAMDNLDAIAAVLVAGGRAPHTPAICVQDGSLPTQRSVSGTIATIAADVRRAGLTAPAVVVIGDVVGALSS